MFKDTLKKLRKDHKLTQEQLAQIVGVERSSVGKYESRNVIPSIDVLNRIADYFSVSVDYLLGREIDYNDSIPVPSRPGSKWIPVLGKVAAGTPIEAIEEILDYEEIDAHTAATGRHYVLFTTFINRSELVA